MPLGGAISEQVAAAGVTTPGVTPGDGNIVCAGDLLTGLAGDLLTGLAVAVATGE